jgi:hypothetical protein
MTLKDAIIAVNREMAEEVSPGMIHANTMSIIKELDRTMSVIEEHRKQDAEVKASEIAGSLLGLARKMQTPAEDFVSLVLRFGMRVQRKMDHPERVTGVGLGSGETAAEGEKAEKGEETPKEKVN